MRYAVELVSLAYGMSEQELLSIAVNGKNELLEALSEANQEPIEKTKEFWKKLNKNLLIVKDLQVISIGETGEERKENDQDFIDGVSNLINLCIEKREEMLDKVVSNKDGGLSTTGMELFCNEMKYSFNALRKLSTNSAMKRSLSKKIQEKTRDDLGRFRAKIIATEDTIKGLENPDEPLRRLSQNNYGLDSIDTKNVDYFELDPQYIEEIAQTKPDEKSWGHSQVFEDTKFIFMSKGLFKGLGRLKEFFIKPQPTLNEGSSTTLNEEDIPERITFDEELKVDLNTEKSNDTNNYTNVNLSKGKKENER